MSPDASDLPFQPPLSPPPGLIEPAAEPSEGVAPPRRRLRPRRPGRRATRLAVGGALVLTLLGGGFGAGAVADHAFFSAPSGAPADAAHFDLIRQAWDILHQQYVGAANLDGTKLADGAIDGLAQAVGDEGHTRFLTKDERDRENAELAGSFAGIGIQVDQRDGQLVVAGVFPASPARDAGLQSGDRIVAIDGRPTAQQPLDQLLQGLRGAVGTSVRISFQHAGSASPIEATVTRREVKVPAVEWAMVPGTWTADVHLVEFSSGSANELKAALEAARKAGATSVILDLRGNPGGYVNEAITTASQFLRDGLVFRDRDAQGVETTHAVEAGGVAQDLPLVVLVDHGSASSSEIVAGALQDAGRAKLVGQTTFGTGTVLHEFGLSDGSALRVGTLQWLTRDGHQIWHQGIAPDRSVALGTDGRALEPGELGAVGRAGIPGVDAQLEAALQLLVGATAR
ncbi:MAG: S41 family peptidase [Candidatus Limnocylindrales bacterium]